jgi:anthranilate synthase component I
MRRSGVRSPSAPPIPHPPVSAPAAARLAGETDLLAVHAADPERFPFLLESAAAGTRQGRFDILFAFPGETVAARAGEAFLPRFDAAWRAARVGKFASADNLPFAGGWFVYLGYELACEIEPTLRLPTPSNDALPIAIATRVPAAIVRDRVRRETVLVAESESLLHALTRAVRETSALQPVAARPLSAPLDEEEPARFLKAVARAKDYIRAGDIYQANLSRLWRGALAPGISHAALYDRLRRANPAPFAGLATFGGRAILSSSPERLVAVRNGRIAARPIAGTRPRGGDGTGDDRALAAELIAHPKERAEHIMLLDLARNDLSRVAVPGTVRVDERMTIESYAHVHHIVSNVTADCVGDVSPADVIRAVFPGGTITGCPKVRSMAIIAELEGTPRGPYTGALGYVGHNGAIDLNILIRTIVRDGDAVSFRTGAGIVADSVPERELAETRAKALGLARALTDNMTETSA